MWRAVVLLALSSLLACHRQVLPVEINTLWKRDFVYVAPVDLNGDSTDELLVIENDIGISCRDQDLRAVTGSWWFDRGTLQPGKSLAGGLDSAHLWLTFKRHDSLYLRTLPGREALVAAGKDVRPPVGWDGYVSAVAVVDIDNDRHLEAVVTVASGMDRRPRGVYALDWLSGKLRWKFETGPVVPYVTVRDVDGDGRSELLFGSGAVGNGNAANGTTDESSYVFLLGCDGQTRWRTPIGDYSSNVNAAWMGDSPPGGPAVVAWENGDRAGGRSSDSLFILDGSTGDVLRRTGFGTFTNCAAVAVDERGRPIAVVAGADRVLRLINANLDLLRAVHLTCAVDYVITGCFSHAAGRELAVFTRDGRLRLMDCALNCLKEEDFGTTGDVHELSAVRFGGRNRLLLHRTGDNLSTWSLIDVAQLSPSGQGVPIGGVVGVVTALTLAFAATLLWLRYRHTHDIRMIVRGLTGQAGVVELSPRGSIRRTNQRARELLKGEMLPAGPMTQAVQAALGEPLGSAPKEMPVALDAGRTVLARAARVRSGVMLTLEDISAVEYLQRVKAWAPVAQKLAHGIKNPLGTIMGAAEQIENEISKGRQGESDRGIKGTSAESDEARGERLEARSPKSETRPPEPVNPGTPMSSDDRVKKYVGYVKDEVTRLKRMADAFMRFTKLNPPALQPRDVNELVRKVVAKYEGVLAKGISLELNLDERLPLVALDEEGITSVLDIVVENAMEAMTGWSQRLEARSEKLEVPEPEKVLRIRTAARSSTTKAPRHEGPDGMSADTRTPEPLNPSTLVSIEVEDTGMGIPEKYLDKVFEPYFTYGKPDGTGLGLALAKKIVEDHKGRIDIQSKEGTGTTVTITLPIERRTDA